VHDEAILASLDRDPDAIATFYRRHAGRLLDHLVRCTQDPRLAAELCAETFATALSGAHRFDPEHGDAAKWLDGIGRRLLARAERRGSADGRARRRLGMAPLEPGDGFLPALEEELVAAARFRASRRRPRPRPRLPSLPRPPARVVRGALAGVAAVALAAGVAALALGGDDRSEPPPQPVGSVAQLAPMLAPVDCPGLVAREEPAVPAMPYLAVLTYRQGLDDRLPLAVAAGLPVATLDSGETRLAANGRRGTRLHVVPSLAVSDDAGCVADDGPGACLVEANGGAFRCFTLAAVLDGHAFARTERGSIAGIVPDGVGRVTLSAGGRRASARVADNVYEAELGVPSGTPVGVVLARPAESGCPREVAPALLARNATLRRAAGDRLLPQAVLERLRDDERIGEVVERGARFWGADGGVEFWAVPIARAGGGECAPADAVCVAAITVGGSADAQCGLSVARDRPNWRFAPLLLENAAIYGTVPDGVTGARVSLGTLAAEVRARDNVLAGVLPFPYAGSAEVELMRRPAPPGSSASRGAD
jgi:hypothetical protein